MLKGGLFALHSHILDLKALKQGLPVRNRLYLLLNGLFDRAGVPLYDLESLRSQWFQLVVVQCDAVIVTTLLSIDLVFDMNQLAHFVQGLDASFTLLLLLVFNIDDTFDTFNALEEFFEACEALECYADVHSGKVHVSEQILIDLLTVEDLPDFIHMVFGALEVLLESATRGKDEPVLGKLYVFGVADDGCDQLNSLQGLLLLLSDFFLEVHDVSIGDHVDRDEDLDLLILKCDVRQDVLLEVQF